MNSSLQQFITCSSYDAQHQKLVPPYWRFKLHIEAQISSGVLTVGNPFTQVEFSIMMMFLYFWL
jgi:hypothetical protein